MPKKLTTEEFIQRANIIHKGRYDYSKSIYKNAVTEICIICPQHGEFWQSPHSHLSGKGCKKCGVEKCREAKLHNTVQFIQKAKEIHGDKYDYSNVEYISANKKVCIICPEHGEFWQTPNKHLCKRGCSKCGKENGIKLRTKTTQEFIRCARKKYGDLYDYSQVEYVKAKLKVNVICKKHGVYQVSPDNHLMGKGCPKCKSSHMEVEIRKLLDENNINFEEQKRFDWLELQSLDFYIPCKNIVIECQGEQHFKAKKLFGGVSGLNKIKERDKVKREKCKLHNMTILYYADYNIDFPYMVYTDKNEILREIKHNNTIEENVTTDTEKDKGN